MAKVYIETTIPSFYFETRTDARTIAWRESTRLWWDVHRLGYEIVSSNIVLRELRNAPQPKAQEMEAMLKDVNMLGDIPGLIDTAGYYIEHQLLPKDSLVDALHLAITSLHNIEYLLTWNIRHLANANKTRHLQVLNGRLGLASPIITTPDMLVPETSDGDSS